MAQNKPKNRMNPLNPLPTLLTLLLLAALTSCKLEIDASGSGSGNIQTASGTIDCDYDGSSTSNDCVQEYVTDITECDNYESTLNPEDSDEWSELPECTHVDPTWSETFVATADESSTFGGWHENCAGGSSCSYEVDEDDVDNESTYTVEARFEPESEPEAVSYTYNHLGQRKSKTTGTAPNQITTYYIYDPAGRLIMEQTNETSPLIKHYYYMEGELIAIHEKRDLADPLTDPEAIHYVVNNHLGQPMYMVSRSNSLHYERYQTPFGQTCSEYQVNTISEHNTRFPGQTYEAETGYHQNWHRDYDPSIGRYMQADRLDNLSRTHEPELLLAASMGAIELPEYMSNNHLYGYVYQNPVMWIDPLGLQGHRGRSAGAPGERWEDMSCEKREQRIEMQRDLAMEFAMAGAGVWNFAKWKRGFEYVDRYGNRWAPWGNRTGHPTGRWPHYHRRKTDPNTGQTVPGGSRKRHRPWDKKATDQSWWDRW